MKSTQGPREIGAQQYSDMPHACIDATSLDRTMLRVDKLDRDIMIEEELYHSMLETLLILNNKLHNLQGVEYKVMYKHDIEGKTTEKIAQELNYSDRQIQRIVARIKRRK